MTALPHLGLGIGWRPALASVVQARADLGFVELVAEAYPEHRPLPLPVQELRRRGVQVVPHGLRLSLGGADRPDPARLAALASLALRVEAPLVSEHVAFVRSGGREAGHLLPVPRTRAQLDVLAANVRSAMAELPVPLALEPIATLVEWPEPELDEGAFLTELLERTDALLLLDVANVYANARNHGADPCALLDRLPLERVAYVHVAGGVERGGLYHDTHAHPVPAAVTELLTELARRRPPPGAMLEVDHHPPTAGELHVELDKIRDAARLVSAVRSAGLPAVAGQGWAAARGVEPPAGDRERLARRQDELLSSVLAGGVPPAGFDAARLQALAGALACKRAGEAARAAPALAAAAGPAFHDRFAAYAAAHPAPGDGPGADAEAFARVIGLDEVGRRRARWPVARRRRPVPD